MTRTLAIGAGVLAATAGILLWRLLAAHERLGEAELRAQLNADAVALLQTQEQINQQIDARLERLASARDGKTREIVREIFIQPSSDACRKSPAMRALDGKLQYQPGHPDGRPSAATTPAQQVPAPGRSP